MNLTKYLLCLVFLLIMSAGVFGKGKINLDYDGKADFLVFRPSNGNWYGYGTETGSYFQVQWGLSTDKAVPADYDGDGITDVAVFRPETGVWYIRRSRDAQMLAVRWGLATDDLVHADYDGDGHTDIAVYRRSNGIWYVLTSSSGYNPVYFDSRALLPSELPVNSSLVPVPADYDNDDKDDFAVRYSGIFFILQSASNTLSRSYAYCDNGIIAPADYTGDGKADATCIVMHPDIIYSWRYRRSQDNQDIDFRWGTGPTDVPAPDDYDNDGHTDLAIYRYGEWWIYPSRTLQPYVFRFGTGGDIAAQWANLKWAR